MVLNRSGLATAILVPIRILASAGWIIRCGPTFYLANDTDPERGIQTEAFDSPEIEGETDTTLAGVNIFDPRTGNRRRGKYHSPEDPVRILRLFVLKKNDGQLSDSKSPYAG